MYEDEDTIGTLAKRPTAKSSSEISRKPQHRDFDYVYEAMALFTSDIPEQKTNVDCVLMLTPMLGDFSSHGALLKVFLRIPTLMVIPIYMLFMAHSIYKGKTVASRLGSVLLYVIPLLFFSRLLGLIFHVVYSFLHTLLLV